MRLLISHLGAIAVDESDVLSVRAEDSSGHFGVMDRHADLVTALEPSVVSWRRSDGSEGYCAVRRGVLTVERGKTVAVATREAVVDSDLARLESTVMAEFRRHDAVEREARVASARMELQAMREILRYLRPERVALEVGGASRGVSAQGDIG